MKRRVYLHMRGLEEARALFFDRFAGLVLGEEEIEARSASGRVTSGPVTARLSAPSFHAAAMDGIAVRAEDTFGAGDEAPIKLDRASGTFAEINTGHPLPDTANAVIMVEQVVFQDQGRVAVIRAPAHPWQHVRKIGEDIVATELLFPGMHLIRPADVGALLTAGRPRVRVRRRPRLTIIPTGSELVQADVDASRMPAGATVESNSAVLAAMAVEAGAEVTVTEPVQDVAPAIRAALEAALAGAADMVVINAGSSAGSADYTVGIIEELGEVLVHGVTIMPGKPTILGAVQGRPVVGNPGYPVSAIISCEQFILPLLASMGGREPESRPRLRARLARNLVSRSGIEEFRRMITGRISGQHVTVPVKNGAGAITTVTRANSLLRIPAADEGIVKDAEVEVELLRSQAEIERTLLCTGSHDLCLDLLSDFLRRERPAVFLASTHVGSLGGIMAVRGGMTHLAGTHLLDPATGDYNRSYVERYLPGRAVSLVTLVHRQQGFMVRPGNPRGIGSIEDLVRDDLVIVNRQAGSGTRVLLDHELTRAGLDPDRVRGYDVEEYTHMAVAAAVLSGKADAGLGILAAALALGLDFVPVVEERYDLLLPSEFLELDMVRRLLDLVVSSRFQEAVSAMGGYSTRETGTMVLGG